MVTDTPSGARNLRFNEVDHFAFQINNPHVSLPAASRELCGSERYFIAETLAHPLQKTDSNRVALVF